MSFLDLWMSTSGNNQGGYNNPEYDKLVTAAMYEADEAKRMELMLRLEQIIADDAVVGSIYFRAESVVENGEYVGAVRTAKHDNTLRYARMNE
jgi:oligopeptide transport system substrate-binding protein